MKHIITENVKKLVKEDLINILKYLAGFILFYIVTILPLITFNFNIEIHFIGSFIGLFLIGGFLSSIGEALELPKHVSNGITRKEFYIATIIGLVTFNLVGLIVILLYSSLFNPIDIFGMTAFSLLLWGGYSIGFIVTIIFIRFHWIVGLLGLFVTWRSTLFFITPLLNLRNLEIGGSHSTEVALMILFTIILVVVAYFLTKDMPVKVK